MGEFRPSVKPFKEISPGTWWGTFAIYEPKGGKKIWVRGGIYNHDPEDIDRTYHADSERDLKEFLTNRSFSTSRGTFVWRNSKSPEGYPDLLSICDYRRGEKFPSESGTISFY
jgi:hypothetical protein